MLCLAFCERPSRYVRGIVLRFCSSVYPSSRRVPLATGIVYGGPMRVAAARRIGDPFDRDSTFLSGKDARIKKKYTEFRMNF